MTAGLETAKKLDAKGYAPLAAYPRADGKYIMENSWVDIFNKSDNKEGVQQFMENLLRLKTPTLWNAFVALKGEIVFSPISDIEDKKIPSGNYSSATRNEEGHLQFYPTINCFQNSKDATLAHELAHFMDDAGPIFCPKGGHCQHNMGFHNDNNLWKLIVDAVNNMHQPEDEHILKRISGYTDQKKAKEYFAESAELHLFKGEHVTSLSNITRKYFGSIVEFDAKLCLQDKPAAEIMEDRRKFQSMIDRMVSEEFEERVIVEARPGHDRAVEQLIGNKIDAIIREARKTFDIKGKPSLACA